MLKNLGVPVRGRADRPRSRQHREARRLKRGVRTEIATALGRINDALGGGPDTEPTDEPADRTSDDLDDGGSAPDNR